MDTKRAADGSPLWTCKHCGRPKRRKDMHTHGSAGNVCKACYDNTEVVDRKDLRISWVMANYAPRDRKREVDARDRTVWKYVKAFLCYYRLPENKKNFNEAFHKKRIIPALFNRRRKFPDTVSKPIMQALADYAMDDRTVLWLALREGVFSDLVLRKLAVELAEQAIQFTDVATEHPTVHGVLNALHSFTGVDSRQTLSVPREQVYGLQQSFDDEDVFVKAQVRAAVRALGAACFRSSRDAAIVAMSHAYEALVREGVRHNDILSTFASAVRGIAQNVLWSLELPEVKPWNGLEEV